LVCTLWTTCSLAMGETKSSVTKEASLNLRHLFHGGEKICRPDVRLPYLPNRDTVPAGKRKSDRQVGKLLTGIERCRKRVAHKTARVDVGEGGTVVRSGTTQDRAATGFPR